MSGVPCGMTERFIARARTQGISINGNAVLQKRQHFSLWKAPAVVGLAASVLMFGFFAVRTAPRPRARHQGVTRAIAQTRISSNSPQQPTSSQESRDQMKELQRQLATERAHVNELSVRMTSDRLPWKRKTTN